MDEVAALLAPPRPSVDRTDTEDELSLSDTDYPSTRKLRQGHARSVSPPPISRPVRGMPDLERVEHSGRQTGPKGVRDDARAAAAAARQRAQAAVKATRAEQGRRAILAPSYRQEVEWEAEEARRAMEAVVIKHADESEDEELEAIRRRRLNALKRSTVREVGEVGYVSAVERRGWVLVAIYEPDMPRCEALLASLSIAGVPAVRARATRIGFALLPPSADGTRLDLAGYYGNEDTDDEDTGRRADPDVLPTLLAYHDGELVHNWVRVDLEPAYAMGLGALLASEGIPPQHDGDESD